MGELTAALCDGELTPQGAVRLEELIAASSAARQYFHDYVLLNAELCWECAVEKPATGRKPGGTSLPPRRWFSLTRKALIPSAVAAALVLAVGIGLWGLFRGRRDGPPAAPVAAAPTPLPAVAGSLPPPAEVARLGGTGGPLGPRVAARRKPADVVPAALFRSARGWPRWCSTVAFACSSERPPCSKRNRQPACGWCKEPSTSASPTPLRDSWFAHRWRRLSIRAPSSACRSSRAEPAKSKSSPAAWRFQSGPAWWGGVPAGDASGRGGAGPPVDRNGSSRLEHIPRWHAALCSVPGRLCWGLQSLVAADPHLIHYYPFEGSTAQEKRRDRRGQLPLLEVPMSNGSSGGAVDYSAFGYDAGRLGIRPFRAQQQGNSSGVGLQSEDVFQPPRAMTVELLLRCDCAERSENGMISAAHRHAAGPPQLQFLRGLAGARQAGAVIRRPGRLAGKRFSLAPGHWYYLASSFDAEQQETVVNTYVSDLTTPKSGFAWVVRNRSIPGTPRPAAWGSARGLTVTLPTPTPGSALWVKSLLTIRSSAKLPSKPTWTH